MINDTERKAFEEVLTTLESAKEKLKLSCGGVREYEGGVPTQILFPMLDSAILHIQAALSTKAQDVGEWVMVPRVPTSKMLKVGDTVAQIASKRGVYPYIANLETVYQAMLYAAPAPSPCTPEEAAELARHTELHVTAMNITTFQNGNVNATSAGLAAIINADRQKR